VQLDQPGAILERYAEADSGGELDVDRGGVPDELQRAPAEAMDGTLTPEETPGGGTTMVVSMPAASPIPVPPTAEDEELLA